MDSQVIMETLQTITNEFKDFKPTIYTIPISISCLLLSIVSIQYLTTPKKVVLRPPPQRKLTPKETSIESLDKHMHHFENEIKPTVEEYLSNSKADSQLSEKDIEYKYNFLQEVILKELFKYDEVDCYGDPELKDKRKSYIKYLQSFQKQLDMFKAENGF